MNTESFKELIKAWYLENGRHDLEWRLDLRPYSILVSELMLQQTQVDRVRPKYREFMFAFPKESILAASDLGTVLRYWQGLGYNRRAKFLWEAVMRVGELGAFPTSVKDLEDLPGVGPYTAGAIAAFAYNEPVVLIETNIRTVFIHHFFPEELNVDDARLLPLVADTLDRLHPREWYWALMDYGSYLKSTAGNASRRSKQYVKQSRFAGSRRQMRGKILRALGEGTKTMDELAALFSEFTHFPTAMKDLVNEGMIQTDTNRYWL